MKEGNSIMRIVVASLAGATIAIAVMLYLKREDVGRMEEMEREVKEFRQETSDNFDSIRAEILANRAKIDTVKANTDTLKAGQSVIYNAVMSYGEGSKEETAHGFLDQIKLFFNL